MKGKAQILPSAIGWNGLSLNRLKATMGIVSDITELPTRDIGRQRGMITNKIWVGKKWHDY